MAAWTLYSSDPCIPWQLLCSLVRGPHSSCGNQYPLRGRPWELSAAGRVTDRSGRVQARQLLALDRCDPHVSGPLSGLCIKSPLLGSLPPLPCCPGSLPNKPLPQDPLSGSAWGTLPGIGDWQGLGQSSRPRQQRVCGWWGSGDDVLSQCGLAGA